MVLRKTIVYRSRIVNDDIACTWPVLLLCWGCVLDKTVWLKKGEVWCGMYKEYVTVSFEESRVSSKMDMIPNSLVVSFSLFTPHDLWWDLFVTYFFSDIFCKSPTWQHQIWMLTVMQFLNFHLHSPLEFHLSTQTDSPLFSCRFQDFQPVTYQSLILSFLGSFLLRLILEWYTQSKYVWGCFLSSSH